MILNDTQIRKAIDLGAVFIEPFVEEQIQPASYDLRVGAKGISSSMDCVRDIKTTGFLELNPGEFAIVMTAEVIAFDKKHTARLGLRSYYARKGIVATTGPQIDPGFKGRLKLGVISLSPHKIVFSHLDDLLTIEIHELAEEVENGYEGPFQDQLDLNADDINAVKDQDKMGLSGVMKTLQVLSGNVSELTANVSKLTADVKRIWQVMTVGLAIIGILITFFSILSPVN